jgi:hypothetical protein
MRLPKTDGAPRLVLVAGRRVTGGLPTAGVHHACRSLERRLAVLKFARTPSRPRLVLSLLLGALAAALCLTPWTITAQTSAKNSILAPPWQLPATYDNVDIELSNATLDRALQEIFKPSRYNFLYADNEFGSEISAHYTNQPLNSVLDTLSEGASFQWAIRHGPRRIVRCCRGVPRQHHVCSSVVD